MRVEGDDPISLAILLDESWAGADKFTRSLDEALARLPVGALTLQDRVSVYAFDCNLVIAARDLPALSPSLPTLLSEVPEQASLHVSAKGDEAHCGNHVGLWDALAVAGLQLEHAPGRRVLLALSPGPTAASRKKPESVRLFLAGQGVSVFAAIPTSTARSTVVAFGEERLFDLLCGGTGGVASLVTGRDISSWLTNTLRMVRGRYVLEFNRPSNESSGLHQIDVTTPKKADRVFVGGVLVPLRDPKLAADPSTVAHAPEQGPVIGTRKILKPQ